MKVPLLSRGQDALLNCAPFNQERSTERVMRSAVARAAGSVEFVSQQNFDRAVAELVRLITVPPEIAEWF